MSKILKIQSISGKIVAGGQKYHLKLKEQNKLFVRARLQLLFDGGEYQEDGIFANCLAGDPADGVITAIGKSMGVRSSPSPMILVKAGSWGQNR